MSPDAGSTLRPFQVATSRSRPTGTPSPEATNTVITTLGTPGADTGKVCVYTNVTTNVVSDSSGSLR